MGIYHFLVVRFALPEISGPDELPHFLVEGPQFGMRPTFHLLAVELNKGKVASILDQSPLRIP